MSMHLDPAASPAYTRVALHIGARLQHARQAAGLDLHWTAHYTGWSVQHITNVETGYRQPSIMLLCRLAYLFDQDPSYFLPDLPTLERIVKNESSYSPTRPAQIYPTHGREKAIFVRSPSELRAALIHDAVRNLKLA